MLVVTLIHGTWASHAPWTDPGSPLSQALLRLDGSHTVLRRFEWSGHNRHLARLRAARTLRQYIRDGAAAYPECTQILIGHSHGGNVALYALRDRAAAQAVAGVVCLSTPFLVVRPRNLGPSGLTPFFMFVTGVVGGLGALLGLVTIPASFMNSFDRAKVGGVAGSIIMLALWLIGSVVLQKVVPEYATASGDSFLPKVVNSFALPPVSERDLLIMRAGGDEASTVLSGTQLLSSLVTAVWRALGSVFTASEQLLAAAERVLQPRWRRVVSAVGVAVAGLLVAGLLLVSHVSDAWSRTADRSGAYVFVICALCVVVLWGLPRFVLGLLQLFQFALSVCLAPIGLVVTMLLLPFGLEASAFGLALEITAEATPPGRWSVYQLRSSVTMALWHSATYSETEGIEYLVGWIAERTRERDSALPRG